MFEFIDENNLSPHQEMLLEIGLSARGSAFWNISTERFREECDKMLNSTNAVPSSDKGKFIWVEDIKNNFDSKFRIKIVVPKDFPYSAPKVFVLDPSISFIEGIHMYPKDNSLCLFHPSEYNSNMSLLDVRNLACAWCTLIENYANTGRWDAAEAH